MWKHIEDDGDMRILVDDQGHTLFKCEKANHMGIVELTRIEDPRTDTPEELSATFQANADMAEELNLYIER